MRKKAYYIQQIMISSISAILLFNIIIKSENLLMKIILIPFAMNVVIILLKNILLINHKQKWADLCSKSYKMIYYIYFFIIIVYWSYLSIRNGNLFNLIITIPFWIVIIYQIYRKFFKRKDEVRSSNFDPRLLVGGLLVGLCFVIGIFMFFFGIKDVYEQSIITRTYVPIEGTFYDYEIYDSDEDGTTYSLIYRYEVEGVTYQVQTNYGTGSIPSYNSKREVRYNPENPQEAVLSGTSGNSALVFIGAFFTLVSLVFVFAFLSGMGYLDHLKFDFMGTYVGAVFLIIGIGVFVMQIGTAGSIVEMFHTMGLWIFIPVLFVIVGGLLLVKSLFINRKQ